MMYNPNERIMVKDRKTNEWYNPVKKFEELKNNPEVIALFKRLKFR